MALFGEVRTAVGLLTRKGPSTSTVIALPSAAKRHRAPSRKFVSIKHACVVSSSGWMGVPGAHGRPYNIRVPVDAGMPYSSHLDKGHFGGSVAEYWCRRPVVSIDEDSDPSTLTHELVHVLLGPSWDTAPAILEEGLADWFGRELRGNERSGTILSRRFASLNLDPELEIPVTVFVRGENEAEELWQEATLTLDLPESSDREVRDLLAIPQNTRWKGMSYGDMRYAYGVGYMLASRIIDRIGLEGLHQLCLDAKASGQSILSPDVLFEAAGIQEGEPFLAEDEAQQVTILWLAGRGGFSRVVTDLLEAYPWLVDAGPYGFLDRVTIRVEIPEGESVELGAAQGFEDWLIRNW